MSRPLSPAMRDAIAAVQSGEMTAYAAAKHFDADQAGLYRQLNKKPPQKCGECGQVIKTKKEGAKK